MMACKLAATPFDYPELLRRWPEFETETALDRYLTERGLKIDVWDGTDLGLEYGRVGLGGSPTRVLKVDLVVLHSRDSQPFAAYNSGVAPLVHELELEYVL
jgi:hypothetical protein